MTSTLLPFIRTFLTPKPFIRPLTTTTTQQPPIRISKLISLHHKSFSRRQAEQLILDGKITFSGQTLQSPAHLIPPDQTHLIRILHGEKSTPLKQEHKNEPSRIWIAHKLRNELVTRDDPFNRPTLSNRLQSSGLGHLKSIGRLDMTSEGLILLTNDGQYAREMELPSNRFHRGYRVRVHGNLTPAKLTALRRGMVVDSIRYKGLQVSLEVLKSVGGRRRREKAANSWLKIVCREGKNRMIRRMLQQLGLKVTRLIRISYGDYTLFNIPPGRVIEVPLKPLETQKHRGLLQIGKTKRVKTEREEEERCTPVEWIKTC